jgi:hypothetical protein
MYRRHDKVFGSSNKHSRANERYNVSEGIVNQREEYVDFDAEKRI